MIVEPERIMTTSIRHYLLPKPRLRRWCGMWLCFSDVAGHTFTGVGHSFEGAYNEWFHLLTRSQRG